METRNLDRKGRMETRNQDRKGRMETRNLDRKGCMEFTYALYDFFSYPLFCSSFLFKSMHFCGIGKTVV